MSIAADWRRRRFWFERHHGRSFKNFERGQPVSKYLDPPAPIVVIPHLLLYLSLDVGRIGKAAATGHRLSSLLLSLYTTTSNQMQLLLETQSCGAVLGNNNSFSPRISTLRIASATSRGKRATTPSIAVTRIISTACTRVHSLMAHDNLARVHQRNPAYFSKAYTFVIIQKLFLLLSRLPRDKVDHPNRRNPRLSQFARLCLS